MESIKFVFFGHIDSGKSTCAGHLYYLCGGISEHEFNNIKKECEEDKATYQLWSRVLDINDEEKLKGKTYEFTLLDFEFKGSKFCLIDNPGHKMFIREMIKGMTYFENSNVIGCLLISAKPGEFEAGWVNGQTKEDIIIAKSLGVKDLVVLVNKMETISWNKKTFDTIVGKVNHFVEKICKFKNIKYIPVSGYDGTGLVDKNNLPQWYSGESVIRTMIDITDLDQEPYPTNKSNKKIIEKEVSKFIGEVKILWCQTVITKGFECVLHYCGQEYDIILDNLPKTFLKKMDVAKCTIIGKQKIIVRSSSKRFILRSGNNTIGFGTIVKLC